MNLLDKPLTDLTADDFGVLRDWFYQCAESKDEGSNQDSDLKLAQTCARLAESLKVKS